MLCALQRVVAALTFTSFACLCQAEVTLYRSTEMNQIGPDSFEFTCVVEYSGIHPSQEFQVELNVVGGGVSTGPSSATLGPGVRNVHVADEAGEWSFQATMRGRTLQFRRILYIDEATKPTAYVCQGSGYNLTTGNTLPSTKVVDFNL